jgi:hypothetical protein
MTGATILAHRAWRAFAALAVSALLIAGCASTRIQAQWTDPASANHPLRGAKVLIVCAAEGSTILRLCQEEVAARIATLGAQPVTASDRDQLAAGAGGKSDKALEAARGIGATALLAMAVRREATVPGPSTTIGIGIGSWGWGGGGAVGGGAGVSVPVGATRVESAYGADMTLTDVATGRTMWTATVISPASSDVGAQIRDIAKTGVAAAQRAGLF